MVTKNTFAALVVLGLFALAFFLLSPGVEAVDPTGANVSDIRTETAPNDTAGSDDALAGNISELTIFAFTTTQTWQGYVGNVTGTVQLADSTDDVLYNWSLANPEGEIYASTNVTIQWREIQCLNYSANGTAVLNTSAAFMGETAGGVNIGGLNLSTIESMYNIAPGDVDGLNETFWLYNVTSGAGNGAGEHDEFFTANLQFTEGECISTRVFGNTSIGLNNEFEEVLLYEPTTMSIVFTSLLEEGSVLGYDQNDYDFEMLVLEDGHGTDTDTLTYYFFVELE